MKIADIRIDPRDDIALEDEQTFPQCLTLAGERAVLRQDLLVNCDRDVVRLGDLAGAVV
jgi:hypothetical protein